MEYLFIQISYVYTSFHFGVEYRQKRDYDERMA